MQLDLLDTNNAQTGTGSNPKLRIVSVYKKLTKNQAESDAKRADDYPWTNDGIMELMEGIFISSIRGLRDRKASSAHFAEEAAWFFDVSNQDDPFSATNCAAMVGCDIDLIRISTARSLSEEKVTIIRLIDSDIKI
jgi:hypothetical protein